MGSRRGRLNWSNLEVHISDNVIEQQHRFNVSNSLSSTSTSTENVIENVTETSPSPPPTKRPWVPKMGVGEIRAEEFVGNFMLTNAEQTALDQKYNKKTSNVECSSVSPMPKSIRISTRLPSIRDTPLSIRTNNLYVGQHLLNVFVCHVESYSHIYIMFGDDYDRATKLFQDMNSCNELIQPLTISFEPKENDLIAIHHEKKWFRGRCLTSTGADINVLCIDSGVTMACSRNDKDRYEAIITKLESSNRPTIVLYYGDVNVNDRLLTILQLL